jgi:hypothetical protein
MKRNKTASANPVMNTMLKKVRSFFDTKGLRGFCSVFIILPFQAPG